MPRSPRHGYTMVEVMVVLAVIIILGAAIVPTMRGYWGNSRQKASADMLQGRVAEARAKAMETGVWYRLALSPDNKRMRLAPDCQNFDSLTAGSSDAPDAQVVEEAFEEGVTATVTKSDSTQSSNAVLYQSSGTPESSGSSTGQASSWTTVATFGPEGLCREGLVTIAVNQHSFQPIYIQVRGVNGSSAIVKGPDNGGNK